MAPEHVRFGLYRGGQGALAAIDLSDSIPSIAVALFEQSSCESPRPSR